MRASEASGHRLGIHASSTGLPLSALLNCPPPGDLPPVGEERPCHEGCEYHGEDTPAQVRFRCGGVRQRQQPPHRQKQRQKRPQDRRHEAEPSEEPPQNFSHRRRPPARHPAECQGQERRAQPGGEGSRCRHRPRYSQGGEHRGPPVGKRPAITAAGTVTDMIAASSTIVRVISHTSRKPSQSRRTPAQSGIMIRCIDRMLRITQRGRRPQRYGRRELSRAFRVRVPGPGRGPRGRAGLEPRRSFRTVPCRASAQCVTVAGVLLVRNWASVREAAPGSNPGARFARSPAGHRLGA
jgi:hypothetical protein